METQNGSFSSNDLLIAVANWDASSGEDLSIAIGPWGIRYQPVLGPNE